METEKLLPIIISSAALCATIVIAFKTSKRTQQFNTSDFKLSQKIKDETIELLAIFRALQLKAFNIAQGFTNTNITKEKEKINSFLHSSTAFAYYVWIGKKSKDSGDSPEEWRVFFLRLTQILGIDDVYSAGNIAAELEALFDTLTEDDFTEITKYLIDIPKAISKFKASREYDPAFQVSVARADQRKAEAKLFPAKLEFLKSKGIVDPTIDLWLGIEYKNDGLVEIALSNGADPTLTDLQLLSRYKTELESFTGNN